MAVRRFPMNTLRAQEFYATVRRLAAERAVAPVAVEQLLRTTPRAAWPTLDRHPDLLNVGALEHLGALLTAQMTRDPVQALEIAELALSVAKALPAESYPPVIMAQTRATAWKDRGKIRSFLARHSEALEDFAQAEREVNGFAVSQHERAIIHLNVAITFTETDRFNEACELLAACKQTFKDHGDTHLFVLAAFYEGVVLQRLRNFREARETYLLLIVSYTEIPKATLAALHQAIGLCSIHLNDFDIAENNLNEAIRIHEELGQPVDAVRPHHGKGTLCLRRGDFLGALAIFRTVRHQYLKHSLAEEAGLCGLQMVEVLLALQRNEQAESLARTIMSEFLAASLNARAITALGYLTEAIASERASPRFANEVHDYVLSLRCEPERDFAEPPPMAPMGAG
ncbi:MAG TPA: hypothetical protein VEK11_20200 [Thermoanaerobaculia bacterium]|nr:hypothetical protein [Thermoanaerobaculia bacterium]